MYFWKNKPLTHGIEKAVLADLKRNMTRKFSVYRLSNFGGKISGLIFWVALMGYFALSIFMDSKGSRLPDQEVKLFAEFIVAAVIVGLVANTFRYSAEAELNKYIDARWQIQPK